MKQFSIFNHVLGPVMAGPSSSHTAGTFHIATMVRSLAGGTPVRVVCTFDPKGSYAQTYVQQGADRAFAMGLLGRTLIEDGFFQARELASEAGLDLRFEVRPISGADHPNLIHIQVQGADGCQLELRARSIGGGDIEITQLGGWPIRLDGCAYDLVAELDQFGLAEVQAGILEHGALISTPFIQRRGQAILLQASRSVDSTDLVAWLRSLPRVRWAAQAAPVYFIQPGTSLFHSAAAMVDLATASGLSLGELAIQYEAKLLGLGRDQLVAEMLRRYRVMEQAVRTGLDPAFEGMQLLAASAGAILTAEAQGRLSLGGPHLRAAARAMAAMHVNSAMGVVCAAPTGGAAGVLPGTLMTLAEERNLAPDMMARALFAAGAVGLVVAQRATFAAEVAGCQVEIGTAGAMAAAAVVEAFGGGAAEACSAAAISFQNTMGLVCDLIQGIAEIPCHTRNALAAANAFLCTDLVLGGYVNPIPLDETIDAVFAVGQMMPSELRCTARGGLALAPSAQALQTRTQGACWGCRE